MKQKLWYEVAVLLLRFFAIDAELFSTVFKHWDEVSAYDRRYDFTDGGSGRLSMVYTFVRRQILRQHSSCRESTLFVRQIRSIPLRCSAIRASSQNDSRMLKSHNGDISKQAILLRDAYSSACFAATCRLNARCSRFPTSTFGTPGACSSTSFSHRFSPSKLHLFVISYTSMMPCAPRE
uniref:Secreted protein n=1 Tax=Anopheles culicifacies TaxID=139723 RepID=A0A182M568_9DIPT